MRNASAATAMMVALGSLASVATTSTDTTNRIVTRSKAEPNRTQGQTLVAPSATKVAQLGLGRRTSNSRGANRRRGPGWSIAKVKRMAAKARNIKRHRAHCRG